jgi:hypothetical protein
MITAMAWRGFLRHLLVVLAVFFQHLRMHTRFMQRQVVTLWHKFPYARYVTAC